jgi:multidrug resistance efflux pump
MAKLQVQLKQKEESGEVLNSIDFDQLNIENAQYQAKIEDKNAELFKLKTIAGGVIQTLNQNKVIFNRIS